MDTIASQITSLTIVYSTVYSDADQRKHQSSAPLAFSRGIHRGPVNSPHKWPVTLKMFPFDDVIMDLVFLAWFRHRCHACCRIHLSAFWENCRSCSLRTSHNWYMCMGNFFGGHVGDPGLKSHCHQRCKAFTLSPHQSKNHSSNHYKTLWVYTPDHASEVIQFQRNFDGMNRHIDVKQKGSALNGYLANCTTLTFDLTHDLDLGFSRSNLEIVLASLGMRGLFDMEWGTHRLTGMIGFDTC